MSEPTSPETSPVTPPGASTPPARSTAPAAGQLRDYVIVSIEGRDAATFLQGYATTDTEQLHGARAQATAFCNLQGRVVANGWLWGSSEHVKLLTRRECGPVLATYLAPYLNFARSTLHLEEHPPLGSIDAATALAVTLDEGRSIAPGTKTPGPSATDSDLSSAWHARATELGEVWIDANTTARFLPQMLGLTQRGAVSFDKGCYLGQEVVARAEHRGQVKRRLNSARLLDESSVQTGDELVDDDGRKRGVVVATTGAQGLLLYVGSEHTNGTVHWRCADEAVNLDLY